MSLSCSFSKHSNKGLGLFANFFPKCTDLVTVHAQLYTHEHKTANASLSPLLLGAGCMQLCSGMTISSVKEKNRLDHMLFFVLVMHTYSAGFEGLQVINLQSFDKSFHFHGT